MRTAYLFSGHLRTFRDNNTLRPLFFDVNPPADCFVHTYRDRNFSGKKWHPDDGGASQAVDLSDVEWLIERYPGIARGRFHTDQISAGYEAMPEHLHNCGFRHTRQLVNEIRLAYEERYGFKYDLVVMLRFDIGLREPFILPEKIEPNTIYAAYNANMARKGLDSDTITYGHPDAIDALNIPAVPPEFVDSIDPNEWCGEKLCTAVRMSRGLKYQTHPLKHFFYRSGGVVLDVETSI